MLEIFSFVSQKIATSSNISFFARGISAGFYKLNEGTGNDWWQVATVIMLVSTDIWSVPISIP